MSSKVSSGNEISGVLYLIDFWFSELGFINDFLETELFTVLGGNSIVEKTLRMMKRSGWKFDAMSSDGVWIWSKPGRDMARLNVRVSPDWFAFGISAMLTWNFGENRENDHEMWSDIESEANKSEDIIHREDDLMKRLESGYMDSALRTLFPKHYFSQ